jgi:hypothetical protein
MRILTTASASVLALFLCSAAIAQTAAPATRSFDNDRAAGTTTIVRDPAAGTFNRDTSVTRKSDGATMTSSTDRTKTDTGFTSESSRVGFDGRTSSRSYERTRTDTGFTETGTATRPDGSTYTLNGSRTRTDTGYNRNRAVTNAEGGTVASRNVDVARANGQRTRNATSTGPQRALRAGGARRR